MTATLIVLLIITLVAMIMLPFCRALIKDRAELHRNPIDRKFEIVISRINHLMMDGHGEVVKFDDNPRMLNLFDDDQANMLIQFFYSTGTLTVILNYKYFHVELVKKFPFHNMRQAETFRQIDVANHFVEEAMIAIRKHQEEVCRTQGFTGPSGDFVFTPTPSDEGMPQREMYSHLDQGERLELLNMARVVFLADGSTAEEFRNSAALRQLLLNLQIDYDTYDREVATRPAYVEMKQLYTIDRTIQVLSVLPIIASSRRNPDARMEAMYGIFEEMRVSREQVDAIIMKMEMVARKFGV